MYWRICWQVFQLFSTYIMYALIWMLTIMIIMDISASCTCAVLSNLWYKVQLSWQWNCRLLRYSWNIACWHCSNFVFILNLTPGFSGLGKDNCKWNQKHLSFGICCVSYIRGLTVYRIQYAHSLLCFVLLWWYKLPVDSCHLYSSIHQGCFISVRAIVWLLWLYLWRIWVK